MLMQHCAIKKGTIIMSAEPFVHVISLKYQGLVCENCLSYKKYDSITLQKCSGCSTLYYCSKRCQKKDWKVHKYECEKMKSMETYPLTETARLIIRVIIKSNYLTNEVGYYLLDKYRTFDDLMSHVTQIKQDENRMEHFNCLNYMITKFFNKDPCLPSTDELLKIYGRLFTNSFHISFMIENIASGLYLGPSVLDHDCSPNANVTFEGTRLLIYCTGTKIYIRSLVDYTDFDISKVRISYIDRMETTESRRQELMKTYYFFCKCNRCEEPDLKSTAMACPNSICKNYCHVENEKCSECGQKIEKEFKQRFEETSDLTTSKLNLINENKDIDLLFKILKMQKDVLHDMNVKKLRTLAAGLNIALDKKLWENVMSFALELCAGYTEYYTLQCDVTVDLYLTLVKVLLYLEKASDALYFLSQIRPTLDIFYGKNHKYYQIFLNMLH